MAFAGRILRAGFCFLQKQPRTNFANAILSDTRGPNRPTPYWAKRIARL